MKIYLVYDWLQKIREENWAEGEKWAKVKEISSPDSLQVPSFI